MRGRRLRVFATTDAVGGIWTYATALAAGLCRRGVATTLAVLGPPPGREATEAASRIPGLRLLLTGLPLDWLALDAEALRGIAAAVARLAGGADLVHLNNPALGVAPFDVPVLAACHSCLATWWDAVQGDALPADLVWQRDILTAGYAAATRLLAPSAAFAAATATTHRLRQPPCVVHNGCAPAPEQAAELADYVFTAGRLWDQGKGLGVLDEAAALIPHPVLAAGPLAGEDGSRIALAHVRALGRLDASHVAARLAARPVFVSAARYEPFGLAVLEAAQAGCALVLSDIPTFRELWGGRRLICAAWKSRRLRRSADPRDG